MFLPRIRPIIALRFGSTVLSPVASRNSVCESRITLRSLPLRLAGQAFHPDRVPAGLSAGRRPAHAIRERNATTRAPTAVGGALVVRTQTAVEETVCACDSIPGHPLVHVRAQTPTAVVTDAGLWPWSRTRRAISARLYAVNLPTAPPSWRRTAAAHLSPGSRPPNATSESRCASSRPGISQRWCDDRAGRCIAPGLELARHSPK